MKKILLSAAGLLISIAGFSQETATSNSMTALYALGALVFVVLLLVIFVTILLLRSFNMLVEQTLKEKAKALGVAYVPEPSYWTKLSQKLNASVPVEQEKDIDLGHSYDGIRELDNHLPPWWKWLFYATIVWAVIYVVVYHVSSSLPLSIAEYEDEVTAADLEKKRFLASQPQMAIDLEKLEYTADAEILARGEKVYTINCVPCHRNDGGGNTIGPNLTDNYWLHGGAVKNIFSTINDGLVEKGMPAWGKTMSQGDVRDVTFFVLSLQGTNPANAKAPQGELMEQKVEQKTDSLKSEASL
ncbi:MAG TPA: cbb3-type cytochrome c oxidase N-terminal domain-containing protein [Chryseolinea sp.]